MNKRIFLKSSILLLSLFFINFNFISAQSCNCPGNFILNPSFENGITNISLADTAGHANPEQVEKMISEIYKMK